jgi:hypothetical protein
MIGLALFCLCCGCHAKRLKAVNDDIRADPEQRALVWDPSSAFIPSIARLPSTANSIGPAARQQHEEMSIATSPPDQKPPPVATDSEQQSIDVDALPLVRRIFDDYAAFFLDYFNSTFHLQTNQEIPKELLTAIGKKESKMANLVLGSTTAESPIRRLRITRVDAGLEVQALNAVIYPSPSYGALPILGVDIIYLNKGQRMLVGMDWAPVQPGPAYHAEHIAPFLEEFLRSLGNITTSPSGKMYGKLPEFFSESCFSRAQSLSRIFERALHIGMLSSAIASVTCKSLWRLRGAIQAALATVRSSSPGRTSTMHGMPRATPRYLFSSGFLARRLRKNW